MKAWQFIDAGEPLKLVELPDPVAGEGQVVLDVRAAGMCHSDVIITDGQGMGWLSHTPIVLGHEVAGVVSQLGPGVKDFRIGDRVVINPVLMVGYYDVTSNNKGNRAPGTGRDGGYAEKALAYTQELVRIPDGVSFEQAAPVTDAGMSSYHAVIVCGQVKKGSRVGIIGLGGLGMVGARVAVLAGAEVYGVANKNLSVIPVATKLGVKECFTKVSDLAPLNCDAIIDFAGMGTTTSEAVMAVAPRGRVVLVGHGKTETTISTYAMALKDITLVGNHGGTSEDIAELFKFVAAGQLDMNPVKIRFDEIGEGINRLKRGEVQGRLVARFGD